MGETEGTKTGEVRNTRRVPLNPGGTTPQRGSSDEFARLQTAESPATSASALGHRAIMATGAILPIIFL